MKIDVYLNVKFLKTTLLVFGAVLFLNSCKNDLKINAPYKEMPSIYAVLCPQEKIQMIRINKVFLGESDAAAMAQVADSINYQPGDLTVTLTRSVNGSPANASPTSQIIVFRDSMIQANPGSFNVNQRVYVSSEKLYTSGEYQLKVVNNKTGNIFTAKSASLDSVQPLYRPYVGVLYPAPAGTPVNDDNYINYGNPGTTYQIRYVKQDPAKIYQMTMRLHYEDYYASGTYREFADYTFNNQYSKDLTGTTNEFKLTFKGQDIFNAVAASMSRKPVPGPGFDGRKMYMVQFFIYSSTQDYMDYLQFVTPSLNLTQDKPLYSNFTDRAALGIFTFRSRSSVCKEMDNSFISQFKFNSSTCSYLFYNFDKSSKGC